MWIFGERCENFSNLLNGSGDVNPALRKEAAFRLITSHRIKHQLHKSDLPYIISYIMRALKNEEDIDALAEGLKAIGRIFSSGVVDEFTLKLDSQGEVWELLSNEGLWTRLTEAKLMNNVRKSFSVQVFALGYRLKVPVATNVLAACMLEKYQSISFRGLNLWSTMEKYDEAIITLYKYATRYDFLGPQGAFNFRFNAIDDEVQKKLEQFVLQGLVQYKGRCPEVHAWEQLAELLHGRKTLLTKNRSHDREVN